MKNRFFILFIIFLLIGIFSSLYAYPKNKKPIESDKLVGVKLCDNINSFLKEEGFNPIIQDIVLNGKNNFPYNILLKIPGESEKNKNIIFTFLQEDVLDNKIAISNFIKHINEKKYNFNTVILFSYGEKQPVEKKGMIYGVDAFLNSINTNDDYTNIIVDLKAKENSIITSSQAITAPSWLIQNELNAYLNSGISENIPYFYLSQMYTYNFFYDRLLTACFDYDIPSIKLNINSNSVEQDIITSVLNESIDSYDSERNRIWDHHFFMARLNGRFKKLTEERTIQIIIAIIFIWLLFLILLIFINSGRKKTAWANISHIWFFVPITFILSCIGFFIGKYIAIAFFTTDSVIHNTFLIAETQLILSFILVSIFYQIVLMYNYSFYEKSIDYLIVISCFLNQSFFILVDISLFPIFMLICILSIIALSIKSNGVHIAIFFLMTIPFFPYIMSMIKFVDFNSLYDFLYSAHLISFFVPLTIYPNFLIYFRILTSIRRKTFLSIPSFMFLCVITISTIIVLLCTLKGVSLEKEKEKKEKNFILVTTEDLIECEYSDKKVFDDLIRTINVHFLEQPEQCNIYVESGKSTPIIYTDNDYEYISPTVSMFNIPSTPPMDMTFIYGTTTDPTIISISAVFPVGNGLDYKTTKEVIKIE